MKLDQPGRVPWTIAERFTLVAFAAAAVLSAVLVASAWDVDLTPMLLVVMLAAAVGRVVYLLVLPRGPAVAADDGGRSPSAVSGVPRSTSDHVRIDPNL